MLSYRVTLLLAASYFGSAACAATVGVPAATAFKAPYLPSSESEVLQEVPGAADPAVKEMRKARAGLDASPQDLAAAIRLADVYIDYGRQIGDAHYAGYAEAVIAPWLARPEPPPTVLLTEATILQYRHQFKEARDLLEKSLRLDARNGQTWLTLATLDMVQGNYAAASRGCVQVSNNAGLELGLACLGNLRSYTGQAKQSLALLHQAEASNGSAAASYQAWIHGLIAESAERLGDWMQAESHYRSALKLLPEDNFLLVAYADFLLDRKRPAEVLPLLEEHAQSDTAFLRLALAKTVMGSPDAAQYTWIMAARFEALKLRGSDYFGREEARFALELEHDPDTSLELAKRNWQVQRAPWDARVLLEAALAAHRPDEAADVLSFIKATHLEDAVVLPLADQVSAQLTAGAALRR